MKTYHVDGASGHSSIHVGERLEAVHHYLPDKKCVIITDEVVNRIYSEKFPPFPVITIGTGEQIKTLSTVESVCRQLIGLGCDRNSFILGIGGGIVCDIAGFVSSIFMRGISFGFVSTTLLSQVDASVGGKNGVNLDAFKNMVGVFSQPEFVLCDLSLLSTLPVPEISNGFAEVVKHGLISDPDLFSFLEANVSKAMKLDQDIIFRLVSDSVRIKSMVVQADETESGERRKLNFGHTLGHAMEKISPGGHGRAVSMGMIAALLFSMERTLLPADVLDRTARLLEALGLPVLLDFNARDIMTAVLKDKKKEDGGLFFIFLEQIGRPRIEKISLEALDRMILKIFK